MKKIITLLLICLMAMSTLSGCGKGSGSSNQAIKLGISGPITGGAAIYGQAVKNGIELALEEVNAKGGLQFELNYQDDKHDTESAVNAYGILKDWGMQVSMLAVTSAPCNAVADMYQEDGIFALTPSGSNENIVKNKDLIFQMCFTDPNQGAGSAKYIADHFKGEKIGVIYQSDIDYSTGVYATFDAGAKEYDLDVVSVNTFIKGEPDFTVALKNCKDAGATVVFLPTYYDENAQILTQAAAMDYHPIFFGIDGMDGVLDVKGFDKSLAEGVYLLTPFAADASDDLTVSFVTKYVDKYGDIPNQFAADAYDCVYAIYEACTKGNVTYDMTPTQIGQILKEQFTKMTFNGLTGKDMTWSASGEVTKAPNAVYIKDGAYVSAE